MKKLFLLVAALVTIGGVAAQQNMQTKAFTFGPKIGMNITDLKFDLAGVDNTSGIKPALAIGAFAEYRTCKWFAVSADVLYSRQGSKLEESVWTMPDQSDKVTVKTDYRLQYLNIPIMANFYVTKGLALKAGIQPGFLVGAKAKIDVNGESNTTDIKKVFKSTDISIPVGISYTFKMGLMIDARYNISVSDISTEELKASFAAQGTTLDKAKNNVFTLSLGWKF